MDDFCFVDDHVATRNGYVIHPGRLYSHSADIGSRNGVDSHHPRTESNLTGNTNINVDLAGSYDLGQDDLDFHGTLKLDAKISETMTGWKHWLAKPIDPFFSKDGTGTLLHIQVVGSSKEPKFGRDKGPKEKEKEK